MSELSDEHALAVERSCAVTAVALSGQRRQGVRLISGARRSFGLSSRLDFIHVPYPLPAHNWTRRTLTCGVALQCSPSKDLLVEYRLNELSARELSALTLVEANVAMGGIAENWPGLLAEIRRLLPDLDVTACDLDAAEMLNRAVAVARSSQQLIVDPLLGTLPRTYTDPQSLADKLRVGVRPRQRAEQWVDDQLLRRTRHCDCSIEHLCGVEVAGRHVEVGQQPANFGQQPGPVLRDPAHRDIRLDECQRTQLAGRQLVQPVFDEEILRR